MAKPTSAAEKSFQESLKRFEARLNAAERQKFKLATLKDLQLSILQIQASQAANSKAMNMARLRKFLEGFNQLGQVAEVFLNSHIFVAFVWGPMKLLLQVANNYSHAFDTILNAYEQIGEAMPLVEQYASLFPGNSHMEQTLAKVYEDILEFHSRALRFFTLPTWKQAFKSVWKDFDSRFGCILQDLRQHKDLIERQASVFHFQQYQSDRQRMFNSFEQIHIAERQRRYLEILRWASVTDSQSDHEDLCELRQSFPQSGLWLLYDPTYAGWRQDSVPRIPTLWLHGIPGAGKTVLASLIVEDCRRDGSAETAYFYCKHGDPQRATCVSVIRTLMCQLLSHDHDLLPWIYDQYLSSGQLSLTSIDLCKELFKTVLLNAKKVYLMIDGLDECELSQRKILLNTLCGAVDACAIQNPGQVRVMLVSQAEADIRKSIPLYSEIHLKPSDNEIDIRSFANVWCKDIQKKFELTDEERDHVRDLSCHRANGMFLFIKLVMSNLYHQTNIEAFEEQIRPHVFPLGLNQAYGRIIDRLDKKPPEERSMARMVLGWMTCARRPLKWHEIQSISTIDVEANDMRLAGKKLLVHISEVCGSLVTQLSGDRLELVHSTAKHYLSDSAFVQPKSIECNLVTLCLKYLSFECFDADLPENERQEYLLKGYFGFQDYAAAHWSDHLTSMVQNGPDIPLSVFQESEGALSSAIIDFVARYELFEGTAPQDDDVRLTCFYEHEFFNDLKHAFNHVQQRKARGIESLDKISPESLGTAVSTNRKILEGLALSQTLEPSGRKNLISFYGTKWFKCPKAACFYFHEGFEYETAREAHTLRHDKPFRCSVQDCETGFKMGFTMKKDLDKHTALYHPELGQTGVQFSRLKKTSSKNDSDSDTSNVSSPTKTKHPAVFACNLCSRRFTRAGILKSHLRTHNNEKPFRCSVCDQAFARQNDCKRHEKGHMGLKFVCEVTCTLPPRDTGCGKVFPRQDQLAAHHKGAGKACYAPKLEEEKLRKQWEHQLEQIIGKGANLPIPTALREQFPNFDPLDWRRLVQNQEVHIEPVTPSQENFDEKELTESSQEADIVIDSIEIEANDGVGVEI